MTPSKTPDLSIRTELMALIEQYGMPNVTDNLLSLATNEDVGEFFTFCVLYHLARYARTNALSLCTLHIDSSPPVELRGVFNLTEEECNELLQVARYHINERQGNVIAPDLDVTHLIGHIDKQITEVDESLERLNVSRTNTWWGNRLHINRIDTAINNLTQAKMALHSLKRDCEQFNTTIKAPKQVRESLYHEWDGIRKSDVVGHVQLSFEL